MNCHPDDQAEIDRLHSEFIAVDEPNNEQVMAFQDASYAIGLKRGQAHEAALQQRLNEADQRAYDAFSLLCEWRNNTDEAKDWSDFERRIDQLTKDSPEVGS